MLTGTTLKFTAPRTRPTRNASVVAVYSFLDESILKQSSDKVGTYGPRVAPPLGVGLVMVGPWPWWWGGRGRFGPAGARQLFA